jgi:aminoglycoside phosphotransferase (APT) family kinase protein
VPAGRMHADELDVDVALVRRLLAAQFPQWAGLPVEPVASAGTVNALFRLGAGMAVRLPRIGGGVQDVERERRWLPRLAPLLPVAIPVVLGEGRPAEGYPWPWSVYRWLDGENPSRDRLADPGALAADLAAFVAALRGVQPADGPPAYRGVPLATVDAEARTAIARLHGEVDADAAGAAWEAALRAPAWPGPPVWVHVDLMPGNLLVRDGRLSGVLDFATVGVGDPACDLVVAWYLLPAGARQAFRAAVDVDAATWARGRGWALSMALVQLPYYRDTNPVVAADARHVIGEVLREHVVDDARAEHEQPN